MSLWLAPIGAVLAIGFAIYLVCWIMKQDEGTPEMVQIATWVREGAHAYLVQQYKIVGIFFAAVFIILYLMVWQGYLVFFVPFAFLTGGVFSGLAGFIGMAVATNASSRTANAARSSLNAALRVAFSSGAVLGMFVVGLALVDLSVWYFILDHYYRLLPEAEKIRNITSTMLCFGMGASSMALFARLGGGIYTKAADVGADLVGKVEAGIPEDDPRNPAVIADQVGDNVGDVAGMGADLYESYVGAIVATMALGAAAFGHLGMSLQGITIPLMMAAVGVVASIIGTFFVHTGEDATQQMLLRALRKGVFVTAGFVAVASFFVVRLTLGMEYIGIYWAVIFGLLAGIVIGISTEYYTSDRYHPTRAIAKAADAGPATLIIEGLSVGMLSTAIPVLAVCAAALASFYLSGGSDNLGLGLYGIGIASVGMLSTLGITLATDAYGPVADNAGGNAEMSHQPPEVRERTDALDSLGNTTAATGKGFAIGSAALSALALIAAYRERVEFFGVDLSTDLMNPPVLVGLFIGVMLPFLFCSLSMRAVGRAAGSIVVEVRRQFREITGIMTGDAQPDYAHCVNLCTKAAQKEMVLPSLLALLSPIVVGLLLGISAVVGLLTGALVGGFALAIMMANTGGAWDNAKKYIEKGHHGGKGSDQHKAAVVGDTVGDPLKDTSGPSLNILIKLMSMVSIVFASFVIANTIIK